MAREFFLQNEEGEIRRTWVGFSWTMLFFNVLAPLFRWDLPTFAGLIGANALLWLLSPSAAFYSCLSSLPGFIYAFFWNRFYTNRYLRRGYDFAGSPAMAAHGRQILQKPNIFGNIICILGTIFALYGAFSLPGCSGETRI